MTYQNIKIEIDDGIAVLTLNRPETRNALDFLTWDEIRTGMKELRDNADVRIIIMTGAGGKAFASGADIKALYTRKPMEVMNGDITEILYDMSMMTKPIIAAIDGFALGGGCELAMACDIRIATKKSKFGQPEVNLGIIPAVGGTQRLPRLVGVAKAKELIFTGDIISAEEAERIGLIQKVVEDADALMPAAKEMAKKMKTKGPIALRLAKMAINVGANIDLSSGLTFEKYCQTIAFTTEDKAEGTLAFIEKRPANFTGK